MEKEILKINRLHLKNIIKDMGEEKVLKLKEEFLIEYTQDAVGMEGKNEIPAKEIKRLIKSRKIDGYSEREQKEVLNHVDCFIQIKQWVEKGVEDISEDMLKDLHEALTKDIFQGGVYRNLNIQIVGAKHQPTSHFKVHDRMKRIFENEEFKKMTNFDKGLYYSAQLAKIHPFLDANGRLGRLVMNFYLLKDDYLAVSIPKELGDEYFTHLESFKIDDDIEPLTNFIKQLLNNRYEKLIQKLE